MVKKRLLARIIQLQTLPNLEVFEHEGIRFRRQSGGDHLYYTLNIHDPKMPA
jgi:hypothetical protein